MSLKPLCACLERATAVWRGTPICTECLALSQDHEAARHGIGLLYAQATEPGCEVIAEWADEAAEGLRADQTR